MNRVNVIIAKRGRNEYLKVCLDYLDYSNFIAELDVEVYVIDDVVQVYPTLPFSYSNINVNYMLCKNNTSDLFVKSALLNQGIYHMRKNYDWLSVVDIDMVVDGMFFRTIANNMNKRSYIISNGKNLNKTLTQSLLSQSRLVTPSVSTRKLDFCAGNSQVSIHKEVVNLLFSIYKEELYSTEYEGWGCEDSELSFKARDMHIMKLIERKHIRDMWFHLYHESSKDFKLYERNNNIFMKRVSDNFVTLKRWLDEQCNNSNLQTSRGCTTST